MRKAQACVDAEDRKEYYKILNVPRTATAAEVKKAYHAEARVWHPGVFYVLIRNN